MLTLPLHIEYRRGAADAPTAWLIPGGDAEVWLRELVDAGLATATTALMVLPGATPVERRGVLVLPDAGASVTRVPSRWQPYARLARQLYLPLNAALVPAIAEDELETLLADDAVYLFHPVAGLVAFDATCSLRVADLLATPTESAADWLHARPGFGYIKRLWSVEPQQTFDLGSLLDAARGDIGTKPIDVDLLPRSPLEPDDGTMSKLAQGGKAALAAMVAYLTQFSPQTAMRPTWVNAVEAWAHRVLGQRVQGLDATRNREILRLLRLLEQDPDQGLKYALPLFGDPHRGQAAPGGRLGERNVAYTGTRSGGAADPWEVQEQHRQSLERRYRELANRELQLGRHARAAYILANLLGDYANAASALEQGRMYREAAVIYRERLKRPLEEAHCLERGGLLTEAITCYEALHEWEKSGDLYARLEQPVEAAAAFESAVVKKRLEGNSQEAARLLEHKLADGARAADELWAAWPDSRQAVECLRSYFDLLARRGAHDLALSRAGELVAPTLASASRLAAVDQLAQLATNYPSPQVQARAADTARVAISAELPRSEHRGRLLNALRQLVPADRLLSRDCARFQQQSNVRQPQRVSQVRRPNFRCELVREFHFGEHIEWHTAITLGDSFVAAGYDGREVVMRRARWNGEGSSPLSQKPWIVESSFVGQPILLATDRAAASTVFAHVLGAPPFDNIRDFLPRDGLGRLNVGSHPSATSQTIAASCCPGGPYWELARKNGRIVLSQYRHDGQLVSTHDVDDEQAIGSGVASVLARHQRVYVAIDETLHLIGGHAPKRIELPDNPLRLAGSAVHTRPRVAASFARGGAVIWDYPDTASVEAFGKDLESPQATFTPHGWLVVAAQEESHVYLTQDSKLTFKAIGPGSNSPPIAVMATDHARQYATLTRDGRVAVYGIPNVQ
jgi:tetratricopeptide (TPR) repeat protein